MVESASLIDESLKPYSEQLNSKIIDLRRKNQNEIEKLKSEIEELNVRLQDKEMQSDRSENADYHIAVDSRDMKLSILNTRIQKDADLYAEVDSYRPSGFVTQGTTLELKILNINGNNNIDHIVKGRDKWIIRLVSDGTSKATYGLVSVQSPVGAALLNHKAKDIIKVDTPYGNITYSIERIY